MSDRVSDGLLAELQELIDDETFRGLYWSMTANMLTAVAPLAATAEEVEAANNALLAAIHTAPEYALREMEIGECVAELRGYLGGVGGSAGSQEGPEQ